MAIRLILNIDAVDDLRSSSAYGTAAAAIVERGTAEAGTYAAMATATLVAAQSQYEVWDAAGTDVSWYRYRIANGALTVFSDYSDPFRATALASYASLDDLIARLNLPDETRYALLASILENVSGQLDVECGRQFYRAPQVSGDEARLYDGDGRAALHEPDGIVSVTTVEVRDDAASAWYTLDTDSWTLRPLRPEPGRPYSHVVLLDTAEDYTYFPAGLATVRVTGAFGFATVPPLVREAVIQMASRVYAESQTRYGGMAGLPDGAPSEMPMLRPDAWHRAVRAFSRHAGMAL